MALIMPLMPQRVQPKKEYTSLPIQQVRIVQEFFCKKVLNLSDYETSLRSALTVHSKLVNVTPASLRQILRLWGYTKNSSPKSPQISSPILPASSSAPSRPTLSGDLRFASVYPPFRPPKGETGFPKNKFSLS